MQHTKTSSMMRLCSIAQLINTTMGIECLVVNPQEGIFAEIPPDHLAGCFCKQLSSITGEENNIDHLFKRCNKPEKSLEYFVYTCPFGLTNMIIPVIKDNNLIAALQAGPILTIDPEEILQKFALSRTNMSVEYLLQLREYLNSLPNGDLNYAYSVAMILTMMIANNTEYLEDNAIEVRRIEASGSSSSCDEVVGAALKFISSNYTDNEISLNTVAKNVYVHPSHLSRVFSQQINCHFRAYINTLRVNLAVKLLDETDMPIGEICHEVGYTDHSYFNKIFKQTMGETPGQYRKNRLREHSAHQ